MKVTVLNNQSLFDIAVQVYGSADAAFDIALLNNLSLTDTLAPGAEIELPRTVYVTSSNKPIAEYYKNRNLKPATADTLKTGIFDESFSPIFN